MDKIIYKLDGVPIAWKRVNPGRGTTKPYDEQKREKMVAGYHIRQQHGDRPMYHGPLHFDAQFFFPIPKQLHKRIAQIQGTFYPFRPDLDNQLKFLLDTVQGVLYENDSCIASICAKRLYDDGNGPRTLFYFEEIK